MSATTIEGSLSLVGYEADLLEKDEFEVIGYTAFHKPDTPDFNLWERLRDDGRLDDLIRVSSQVELFGCSSGVTEIPAGFPEGTYRHTVCIEAAPGTNYDQLRSDDLFKMRFPASKWVCFHMEKERFYDGQHYLFWEDDPYGMIKRLGFRFNGRIPAHMDVFDKPDIGVFHSDDLADRQRLMHFWMPVS